MVIVGVLNQIDFCHQNQLMITILVRNQLACTVNSLHLNTLKNVCLKNVLGIIHDGVKVLNFSDKF